MAVGDLLSEPAAERIDCSGLMVAPGFIDCHCHSELSLVVKPQAESKVTQGVTTEVLGNCGWSAFPTSPSSVDTFRSLASPIFGHAETKWEWDSLSGYLQFIGAKGTAVNVASLVGHGALRAAVMGFSDRAATAQELLDMKRLLAEAMDQGALGLSSGLCYVPGTYAPVEELVELAQVAANHGGLYATHLRDQVDGLISSVKEAIEIGVHTHVPVLISHHKTSGKRNFGKAKITLGLLDDAREAGVPTFSDMYAYLFGSSTMGMLMPPWTLEGSLDDVAERLLTRECRARMAKDWECGIAGWENRISAIGWENVIISHVRSDENQSLIGMNVYEAAKARGLAICDFVADLMAHERCEVGQVMLNSCEDDLRMVLTHPRTMVGSDGLDVGDKPHPRQYGSFPKVLGEFVREKQWMSLEIAVHKMTGLTASTFRLPDIGLIRPGYRADIVVFDAATVRENATFLDPKRYSDGIEWVFVSGRPTVKRGLSTGELPGRAIRRADRKSS